MKPKSIWANLTVSDLERTTRFYNALGFEANGTPNSQLTSFFFGDSKLVIHFFARDVLQANVNMELTDPQQTNEVIFTLSAETRDQVDRWADEIRDAGGLLVSEPESKDGFYGFVFADPDGHKFNVFHM